MDVAVKVFCDDNIILCSIEHTGVRCKNKTKKVGNNIHSWLLKM